MTINEIMQTTATTLGPADIAPILGCDPQTLREMAVSDPKALAPLQPIRLGKRVRFPKMRFLAWYYGERYLADQMMVHDWLNYVPECEYDPEQK